MPLYYKADITLPIIILTDKNFAGLVIHKITLYLNRVYFLRGVKSYTFINLA